jgi:hypothetical protein
METEVLSPLYTIAPTASKTFSIEWGVCRCPGPIVDVSDAGCVAEPLKAEFDGEYGRLTGKFGVFDRGELFMVWRNRQGESIRSNSMGTVDPLTAVLLDSVTRVPAGAAAVECQVMPAAGSKQTLLAAATLE